MRSATAAALAAALLAGCGDSERPGARGVDAARADRAQPAADAGRSRTFTVPEKLPPSEGRSRSPARGAAAAPAPAPPSSRPASGAPSDAEVRRELEQALGVEGSARLVDQAGLTRQGLATAPPSAPPRVAAIIAAANQVARLPYRYGGGHGGVPGKETWVDTAYDCSGSMSFALASAGLLEHPLNSTGFMSWGRPGPGKWVTIFANEGHAFMVVAGLRFDTVERARTGTRWGRAFASTSGFTVRHPPGL